MKIILICSFFISFNIFSKYSDQKLCESLLEKTKKMAIPRIFGTKSNKDITNYLINEMKRLNLNPIGNKERTSFSQEFHKINENKELFYGSNKKVKISDFEYIWILY